MSTKLPHRGGGEGRAKALGLLCLASPVLVIAVVSVDARARRAARTAELPAIAAVAARLPTSDLALSGGARWLRSPSLEEPSAAFADGPALPDPDPAGGAMAPPIEVWKAIEERSKRGAAR
jgi:hypothetical protein